MITAVLDTNVVLQAVFGSPRSASTRVLRALDAGRFRAVFTPATVDELLGVLGHPVLRTRHGMSDDEILRFVLSLLADAIMFPDRPIDSSNLPRDVSDTKFLALAEHSAADYLVTNDRRHLLKLKRHGSTRIVTPARFLRELSQRGN